MKHTRQVNFILWYPPTPARTSTPDVGIPKKGAQVNKDVIVCKGSRESSPEQHNTVILIMACSGHYQTPIIIMDCVEDTIKIAYIGKTFPEGSCTWQSLG